MEIPSPTFSSFFRNGPTLPLNPHPHPHLPHSAQAMVTSPSTHLSPTQFQTQLYSLPNNDKKIKKKRRHGLNAIQRHHNRNHRRRRPLPLPRRHLLLSLPIPCVYSFNSKKAASEIWLGLEVGEEFQGDGSRCKSSESVNTD